jgi:hypothetical protein
MEEKRIDFPGAYFSKETILKVANFARIFSWVVVGIYAAQLFIQFTANMLSIIRGYWMGMGYTDMAMSFIYLIETPLRGVVYFVVLQAVAQVLLLLMDMEDNTRRAARQKEGG